MNREEHRRVTAGIALFSALTFLGVTSESSE
jgi:hypothetical protein